METLWRVVSSMRRAADVAGVTVVTGDTKVVDRGKGDGVYVNTAGVGVIEHAPVIAPMSVRPGDVVLLSGDLGRHGMAVMAVREGLEFESAIESDCAPLAGPALALLDAGLDVHCLRDLTRGGLASAVVEMATASGLHLHLDEAAIPVREDVRGACEMLGFDPLLRGQRGALRGAGGRGRRRPCAGPAARVRRVGPGGAHRRGARDAGRPGDAAQPHRRHARDGHAERRAAAENLLKDDRWGLAPPGHLNGCGRGVLSDEGGSSGMTNVGCSPVSDFRKATIFRSSSAV